MIKRKRGETIVEVTVSVAILAVALTGAFTLIFRATQIVAENKAKTRAVNLAEEGAEIAYGYVKGCSEGQIGLFKVNSSGSSLEQAPIGTTVGSLGTLPFTKVGSGNDYYRLIEIEEIDTDKLGVGQQLLPATPEPNESYWRVTTHVKYVYGERSGIVKTVNVVGKIE